MVSADANVLLNWQHTRISIFSDPYGTELACSFDKPLRFELQSEISERSSAPCDWIIWDN